MPLFFKYLETWKLVSTNGVTRAPFLLEGLDDVIILKVFGLDLPGYAYGKTQASPGFGTSAVRRKDREAWIALKPGAHEGYVSWERAEAIRKMVSNNVPQSRHHGAAKHGSALLAELLRCRRRGRKLTVRYTGKKHDIPRYSCWRGLLDNGEPHTPCGSRPPILRTSRGPVLAPVPASELVGWFAPPRGDNRWISTREVRRCNLTLRLAPSSASTSARRSFTSWASTPLAHLSKKQSYDATQFFAEADPTLVGMEACPGSQWLARKLRELGHDVRIIPAQFVKPYVKSHKNDIIDAEAIAEAATRPTMRFVGIKEAHQVDLQMLHRVRSRLVKGRTNLICQMRSYCLEHGVALRQGAGVFKLDIVRAIDNLENDLTDRARVVLRELQEDLLRLEERILSVSAEIKNIADRDETARRLMTIPGVGPLGRRQS